MKFKKDYKYDTNTKRNARAVTDCFRRKSDWHYEC